MICSSDDPDDLIIIVILIMIMIIIVIRFCSVMAPVTTLMTLRAPVGQ